jgi:hypothetical protein
LGLKKVNEKKKRQNDAKENLVAIKDCASQEETSMK